MTDDSCVNRKSQPAGKTVPALVFALIVVGAVAVLFRVQLEGKSIKERAQRDSDRRAAEVVQAQLQQEIDDLQKASAQREAEIAARAEELRQREATIGGREDAATERVQSSFQGLLIQQQLTKNLEALKASLPDMTPEVERLAKEHAQFEAERQRLQKENAELRRRLNSAAPLEGR